MKYINTNTIYDTIYSLYHKYIDNSQCIYISYNSCIVILKLLNSFNVKNKKITNPLYATYKLNDIENDTEFVLMFNKFNLNETIKKSDELKFNNPCIFFKSVQRAYFYELNTSNICGKFIKYYNDGQISTECNYTDGKLCGEYTTYHNNEQLLKGPILMKCNYINGLKCGECIRYFKNESIYNICNYVDDKLHGVKLCYNKHEGNEIKNNLKIKYNYVNGIKCGEYFEYHENGSIRGICNYLDDKLNGLCKNYDQNGTIRLLYNYVNGLKCGEYINYYNDGKIKFKCNYVNGLKCGEYIRYNKTDVQDEQQILKNYNYCNDKLHDCNRYFGYNNQIYIKCNYIDDKLHGEYIRYYILDDSNIHNKIYIKCNYVDDKLHGEYICYDLNGKIIVKIIYSNGVFLSKQIHSLSLKM